MAQPARTGLPGVYDAATERLMGILRPKEKRRAEAAWGGATVLGSFGNLDEYNPRLRGRAAITTADQMRRTSGQVRAVEKVVSLPIRSTAWLIEEADGSGSAEKEAAELLRANLFGGMETSWDDLLREACLGIYFGFRVPEIVWEERGGRVDVRKLASRNPALVEQWLYDSASRLVGYLYAGNRPTGAGLKDASAGMTTSERIPIPIEKTLHFAYDQENENPTGFGLWRSMYPHWYIVQAVYKIVGIGIERNLLGVPYGKGAPGGQIDDTNAMLTVLKRLRAAEDGAFVLPEGWEVDWFESNRSLLDAMPFLQHHDAKIAQVALAQFLNLGQTGTGTQALATVHVRTFERSEEANARWIEQVINSQLVRRWCLLNYGEGLRPPVVRHKPIHATDISVWANALNVLVKGGMLHPTSDDEEFIRDTMELPPISPEQRAKLDAVPEPTPTE